MSYQEDDEYGEEEHEQELFCTSFKYSQETSTEASLNCLIDSLQAIVNLFKELEHDSYFKKMQHQWIYNLIMTVIVNTNFGKLPKSEM